MRILRIETKNVLSLPDGAIDFPLHAVVVGANDSGKSCLYRLVILMAGWSADSLASLVRRDAEGRPLDVTPECVMLVEKEGQRYRLTRKGTDIKTERDVDGAWVKCQGSAAQALAKIAEPATPSGRPGITWMSGLSTPVRRWSPMTITRPLAHSRSSS